MPVACACQCHLAVPGPWTVWTESETGTTGGTTGRPYRLRRNALSTAHTLLNKGTHYCTTKWYLPLLQVYPPVHNIIFYFYSHNSVLETTSTITT